METVVVPARSRSRATRRSTHHDDDDDAGRGPGRRRASSDDDREPEDRLPDRLRARPPGAGQDQPAARPGAASAKAFLDKVRAAEDKKVSQALEKLGVDWTRRARRRGADAASCSWRCSRRADAKIAAGTLTKLQGGGQERRPRRPPTACARCSRATTRSSTRTRWCSARSRPGESKSYELVGQGADLVVHAHRRDQGDALHPARRASRPRGSRSAGQHRGQAAADVRVHATRPSTTRRAATTTARCSGASRCARCDREEHRPGPGDAHRGGAAQRQRPGGDPDQRRALRGQGPRARRDQDVLVRLRGPARLQGRRLPARARGRRHHARRIGDRQDQGQGRAAGAGARGRSRGRRRSCATTRRCARRPADGALVVGRAPKGTAFKATGKLGAFTRVDVDGDRARRSSPRADLKAGGTVHGTFKPEWQVTPPRADGHRADRRRRATPSTSRGTPPTIAWCATSTSGSGTATRRSR